ncbi:hypothetical protein JTE90_021799 [Oedothorax gibbosus]|uniref:Uncharacterized protein n=1 Tax=Oedothorax gibbosus TaxID=931172 RepID=A0AAV6TQ41_9ARAC|nr:hypothetical protein JTE90_021799 [Oedothorax gibbosus]
MSTTIRRKLGTLCACAGKQVKGLGSLSVGRNRMWPMDNFNDGGRQLEISGDDKTRSSIQATCARIIVDRDKPDTRPPHGLEPPGPRGAGKYSIHHQQQSRSQGPGPERPAESKDPRTLLKQ